MSDTRELGVSLAVLRISLAVFFLVWTAEKFVAPGVTAAILQGYYGVEAGPAVSYVMGGIQLVFLALFTLGLARFWSYGFFLITHAVSTVVSYQALLNPFEPPNHLFQAAIPVLGALLALFILRHSDTVLVAPRQTR